MTLPRGAALLAAAFACACASAPAKTPLDAYLDSFASVKASAEDLHLQAAVAAGELAEREEAATLAAGSTKAAPGSPEAAARAAALAKRRETLETRLEALRLVDRYNKTLTGLASGADPRALKGQMQGLGKGLSAFRKGQAAMGAAAVVPYFGAVAQGASLVQDLLAKRRFKQAVREAQAPISAILDILLLDAPSLEEVLVQRLKGEQDPYRAQLDAVGGRLFRLLEGLKPDEETTRLLSRINARRKAAGRPEVPHEAGPDAVAPGPASHEDLAVLLDQTEANALDFTRVEARIESLRAVLQSYRRALEAVRRALGALNRDSEEERGAATKDFNDKALELRQETVHLREAS